jgi:tripartite-type tricarboxylate transporter receptor subunit TctC
VVPDSILLRSFSSGYQRIDLNDTMKRFLSVLFPVCLAALLGCGGGKDAESTVVALPSWPEKTIKLSCPGKAGTTTDQIIRAAAKALASELGMNVVVENVGNVLDGAAINQTWDVPHDGYQWVGLTEFMFTAPRRGVTKHKVSDWNYFLIAEVPAVISVSPQSRLTKIQTLVREAKKEDGQFRVATTAVGGIFHAQMLQLEAATGAKFEHKQFGGSGPSQLAVLAGQADAVITSVGDQASLLKTKKLVPLAILGGERLGGRAYILPGYGEIPSAAELYPVFETSPIRKVVGIAVPADVPAEVLARLGSAIAAVVRNTELIELAGSLSMELSGETAVTSNQLAADAADARAAQAERLLESLKLEAQ